MQIIPRDLRLSRVELLPEHLIWCLTHEVTALTEIAPFVYFMPSGLQKVEVPCQEGASAFC